VDLSINRADQGDRTVVSLGGEIDVYTAPFVRERLDEAVHEGRTNLIVDLTGVRFLDSTGLGVLVGRLKLTRSLGGSLRLVGRDERVLKVFSITGLDKVFEIHPTLDEALAASEAEATAPEAGQGEAPRSEAGDVRADAEGARAASPAKSSDSGA
jgi:anti-sigma B factor antagonist